MYDTFFKSLINRKKQLINDNIKSEQVRKIKIQDKLSLLKREYHNQEQILKSKPKDKEALSNMKAIDKVGHELELELEKINKYISEDDNVTKLEKLYYTLKENKDISSIEIDETNKLITVVTNNIICKETDIGKYMIEVSFKYNKVMISRLDGLYYKLKGDDKGYYHPFIPKHGSPCFGDNEDQIENAIEMGGFYSIILICIELLKYKDNSSVPYINWTSFKNWLNKIQ